MISRRVWSLTRRNSNTTSRNAHAYTTCFIYLYSYSIHLDLGSSHSGHTGRFSAPYIQLALSALKVHGPQAAQDIFNTAQLRFPRDGDVYTYQAQVMHPIVTAKTHKHTHTFDLLMRERKVLIRCLLLAFFSSICTVHSRGR